MRPNVYIIAGPNGAGKTTFAREFLPGYADCQNFINADLIAQGVSPFAPELAAVRAGRLMLNEIENFAKRRLDFGFETTLSGRSISALIRTLSRAGYKINFFYLWIPSVELALRRVRKRVLSGGHDIAESVLRRRFDRSIGNFLRDYRQLADSWILFDNSSERPMIIASEADGKLDRIMAREFDELIKRYGTK